MKNGIRIKTVVASALLVTSTAAMAENSSTMVTYDEAAAQEARSERETTGILGGLLLGAVLGGPPGAIVSAMAGGLLSDQVSDHHERKALKSSLSESRRELASLQQEQRELRRRYELAMEEVQNSRLRPASLQSTQALDCCADSAMVLHFKTNSAEIEAHYLERLADLANAVKAMPDDAVLEITGYADRRGPSGDNLALSRMRTEAVRSRLAEMGLGERDMRISAHGERRPLSGEASLESHFFDRRVDIRVRLPNGDLLTQSSD